MKPNHLIILFFISLFFIPMSAQEPDKDNPEYKIYRAEADKAHQLIHTKLKVSFDIPNEIMFGEEWLKAKPYFYPQDSLILDAKGMLIHAVTINGSPLKYTYTDNNHLRIKLDKTYKKGQEYEIYIKYTAQPNKVTQQGSAAITDAKGLYFIDPRNEDPDKPTQIWTQGETESSSCWFPTIDKPNQKTSQEIYMTVPNQYVTLSNGKLVSQTSAANNTRTDYWKFDQKHAPYLFFMGIGEFEIVKDQYKNIPVDYYMEKEYAPFAKQIFGNTPEMIKFFEQQLNFPYVWNKYAQIVCRDYVSGAMENTTAVIHAENANQKQRQLNDVNVWEDVISHELYHHWFGDLATCESWSNLTLNESFANYSEVLWREYKYGQDYAMEHLYEDTQGYLGGKNSWKHLVRYHYLSREDMFDAVSYNKGGRILHMLRNYLGDDAFFSALSLYLNQNQYKATEAHQLRLALEEVTGKDLNWFFNQWYFNNGQPKLKIEYSTNGKQAKVVIHQEQGDDNLFQFPLAIDIYEKGKATRHNVWAKAEKKQTFEFPISGTPDLILANADEVLLCEIEDNHTIKEISYQLKNAPHFASKMNAISLLKDKQTEKGAIEGLLQGLNDKYAGLRLETLENLDWTNATVKSQGIPMIEKLVLTETNNLVKGKMLSILADEENPKNMPLFANNLIPLSNSVQGGALEGVNALDKQAAANFVNDLNLDDCGGRLLDVSIQIAAENQINSKMNNVAKDTADLFLNTFEDQNTIETFKTTMQWIMSSNNEKATQDFVNGMISVNERYGQYPVITPSVEAVLKGCEQIKKSSGNSSQISIIKAALDKVKPVNK